MAKSAGTLIALGADKIVMGHCSEVGPTDPQIRVAVSNKEQSVSAWTLIWLENVKRAIGLLSESFHFFG
jgi:membrane-bound ClpP family serine protease